MQRDELIDALTSAFTNVAEVVAVSVDGSLGRGTGDSHSDVDLEVTVAEDHVRAITAAVPDIVRSACDAVLVRQLPFATLVVTREWLRADVVVQSTSAQRFAGPDAATAALRTVEELMRCLGLMPIVSARDEWIGGVVGSGLMIGLLTDLMQIENGTHRIGGALRLTERLTPEQRDVLRSLPPLHADRDAGVALQLALARDFLPRARRVATQLGFEHPTELEAALLDHLARHGFELE